MSPVPKRWVSFSEVARQLGVSRATATKRVHDGTVPGLTPFLGGYRVQRQVFEKWLEKQAI